MDIRLKKQYLQIVENQLRANNPPATKETLSRLVSLGYNTKDAKELIATCVAFEISEVIRTQLPFNESRYVSKLNQLPETTR